MEKSRVVLMPCAGYGEDTVYKALKSALALLGGIEQFVQKEEKVLLKPNLLSKAPPEKCVTTHPSVLKAIARILQENGFENLTWGDSPGASGTVSVAEAAGLKAAAEEYQIPMADFGSAVTTDFPQGTYLKKFEICKGALEADGIISLCKMKSHQLTRITGAVKNTFGCVYGLNKGASHARFPKVEEFAGMLVDLNLLLKPRLYIMDGVMAMEGNGPASGTPVPMGVLLLSSDPVALDSVFCRLVDLNPELAPTVRMGGQLGLGQWREDDVEILLPEGAGSWQDLRRETFDVYRKPEPQDRSVKWRALGLAKNIVAKRPQICPDLCVRCGVCVNACPVDPKALQFPDPEHKKAPVYDYRRCIRCYCCQEMCLAGAIEAKVPMPARLILK